MSPDVEHGLRLYRPRSFWSELFNQFQMCSRYPRKPSVQPANGEWVEKPIITAHVKCYSRCLTLKTGALIRQSHDGQTPREVAKGVAASPPHARTSRQDRAGVLTMGKVSLRAVEVVALVLVLSFRLENVNSSYLARENRKCPHSNHEDAHISSSHVRPVA